MFIKDLVEAGLSEKEAKVYLALLELEIAKAQDIAKKSGVNRATTYVILDELIEKGLVSISADKTVKRFVPTNPEALLRRIDEKAKDYQRKSSDLKEVLPELLALHKDTRHRPRVKVYEGKNSAKEVYWSLLSSNAKEIRTYTNPVNVFKRIPNFIEHDIERSKRGIKMFAINPASNEMLSILEHHKPNPPFELVLIPEDKFKFSSDLGIYGNFVTFVSSKEDFGVIIESKEIAEMLKISFDLSFEEAKRISKKILKRDK